MSELCDEMETCRCLKEAYDWIKVNGCQADRNPNKNCDIYNKASLSLKLFPKFRGHDECRTESSYDKRTSGSINIPDGLDLVMHEIPLIIKMIADTARWVHPDVFKQLPVWFPERARGRKRPNEEFSRILTNANGVQKKETNEHANIALKEALGVKNVPNWTVCHIWSNDSQSGGANTVVTNPHYYTCISNMVWLPTPLKGFTDSDPNVKRMLRTCAYYLYGWVCELPEVEEEAQSIREGVIHEHYPQQWPRSIGEHPPGVMPFTDGIRDKINLRKKRISTFINDESATFFPREEVIGVLERWGIVL